MRIKYISLVIAFLLFISVFSSCDISETTKETTASTTETLESTNVPTVDSSEPDEFIPQLPMPEVTPPVITDPKEPSNEFDPEEEVWTYPEVVEHETDLTEVDYSKFVFYNRWESFVAKYGTDYKNVENEKDFDEVLDYFISFDNYVLIDIEGDPNMIESILTNIKYIKIYKKDDSVGLDILKSDLNSDAIKELSRYEGVERVVFIMPYPVDE